MSQLLADARFALRGMRRNKAASLLLVLTLAVGLAANAVVFNLLDVLVLRPFGFPEVPRLVRVFETGPRFDNFDRDDVAPANFLDWREQGRDAFRNLVAMAWWDANVRGEPLPERVQGFKVGPDFFEALGVMPVAGRSFRAEEAQEGRQRVVVLGHDLWQRSFGGDAGVLGRSITIDGEANTVVGIAPRGFAFPDGAEVWSPLVLPSADTASRDRHYLQVFGRLAEGRARGDGKAVLAVVAQRLEREHPTTNTAHGVEAMGFNLGFGDPVLPSLLAFWQVGAVLLLLIACVNVANLVLAVGAERRRELALRLALGAGRRRILAQLLTESLVSSMLAVAAAMPLVAAAMRAFRDNMPPEIARFVPGWTHLEPDLRTLTFSVALALLATAVFSAIPALRASRPDLVEALRDGGRAVTAGGGRQRGRNALVVVQVAGALALVATAGLAVKSAYAVLRGPQGYDPDGLLTFQVTLSHSRYDDAAMRRAYTRDAEARLAGLPGVVSVGVTSNLPASGGSTAMPVEVEGVPLPDKIEPPLVHSRFVSEGYFDTLRLPLVAGRGFRASDDETTPPVAVISRAMAEQYWPGTDALGRRFREARGQNPWITVVGVSGDVIDQWVARRNVPMLYRPLRQEPRHDVAFAVRTSGEPEALATAVRSAVTAIDPDQPAYFVRSMRRQIAQSTIGLQYIAAIMAAFGILALVLAVSGVYGVMSYRVSLRTQEIGVRMALGASRADVLRLTLGQSLRLAAVGLAIGAGLAAAAGRALSAMLHGGIAFDPGVLGLLTVALGLAALAAAFLPARRALAVDPAQALRAD